MKIIDIKTRQGKIECDGCILKKDSVKEFEKFGSKGKLCNCVIKDESGEIKLTLWNDDCDKIKIGDKVKIINGYCNEFQGEKQITAGKFGKLEIL